MVVTVSGCRIPYYLTPSLKRPGLFHLCFYPSNKPFHQNMKITPEGIIHRRKMFSSLTHMVRWFKDHFRDKGVYRSLFASQCGAYQPSHQSLVDVLCLAIVEFFVVLLTRLKAYVV